MEEYLNRIESPADVKRLGMVELERLAEEIRARLIRSVAKTGGHIGPNLGVVELTIAMHYVFRHAEGSASSSTSAIRAYVHKLLTGREQQFSHHPPARRFERLHAAHGERARLLWRRPCGHGAECSAGNGGGSRHVWRRPSTCGGSCRGCGVYQRHQLRGAE